MQIYISWELERVLAHTKTKEKKDKLTLQAYTENILVGYCEMVANTYQLEMPSKIKE